MFAKLSTAKTVLFGPVLDSTGAEYISAAVGDVKICKNNGTPAALDASATLTHKEVGLYELALTANDISAVGVITVVLSKTTYVAAPLRLDVLPALVYDSLVAGTDNLQVDAIQMGGTTLTARDIGASVLLSPGTAAGQISLTSGAVTVGTNNDKTGYTASTVGDKTGYSLTQTFPTNFAAMAITAGGALTVGTNSDKTGYSIATGGIVAASFAAGAIDAAAIATGAVDADALAADAGAEIADAVWDEVMSGHVASGSFGQRLQGLRSGTAQAGAAGSITLDAGASAIDDFYKNAQVQITGGTGANQLRTISGYTGSSKVATITPNWGTNPAADSVFVIQPMGAIAGASAPTAGEVADAVWDEARSGHVTAGSFGEGVASVQGNITGSAASVVGAVGSVTAGVTVTTNNDKTGYSVSTVGDKTGYSLAADQSGATVGTVNALGTQAKADVNAEADAALADVNLDHLAGTATGIPAIPPGTYIDQMMDDGTAVYDRTTDSLQAIRDRGDTAWGAGAVPSVAQIADGVWDELLAGHAIAGSAGEALAAAGTAGDPWITALPGSSYGPGTAGYLIGAALPDLARLLAETKPIQASGRLAARNPHTVNWACINDPPSGAGNWGVSSSAASYWFLTHGHAYRIRQTGDVTALKLYWVSSTNTSVFKIQIWREVRSNVYDLVGESHNLIPQLVAGQMNTIPVTPIAVREGDFIGYVLTTTAAAPYQLQANSGVTGQNTYQTTPDPGISGVAWESKTVYAGVILRIQALGRAPHVVGIGDSILSGGMGHRSFLEGTDITDLYAHITVGVAEALGGVGQNMGVGSETSGNIAARITTDCVNLRPRIAILQGGVNDFAYSGTQAQFIANWTTMLDACKAAGIEAVVCKIAPWTNGTNVQMQTRDAWNAALATLAAGYADAVVVDFDDYVGTNRAGGDAGNKWNIASAYASGDGVHFNGLGYARMGQAILDELGKRDAVPQAAAGVDGGLALHEDVTSTGVGARTVTITVNDGATALQSVKVRVTKAAESYIQSTNVSGQVVFNLDDGSWTVSLTLSGYTYAGTTLVVDGTETPTYSMTQVTFPASDPGMVTGYLYCYDETGVVVQGAIIELRFDSISGTGISNDIAVRTGTSDVAGLVTFTNVLQGATYRLRRGSRGPGVEIAIPADAASPYALPDVWGAD